MKNPFKRKQSIYEIELERLLEEAYSFHPSSDEYQKVLARINELDRMNRRTTEFTKVAMPALGTVGGVVGIYALQQFAGVIVPKALEALGSRSTQKNIQE